MEKNIGCDVLQRKKLPSTWRWSGGLYDLSIALCDRWCDGQTGDDDENNSLWWSESPSNQDTYLGAVMLCIAWPVFSGLVQRSRKRTCWYRVTLHHHEDFSCSILCPTPSSREFLVEVSCLYEILGAKIPLDGNWSLSGYTGIILTPLFDLRVVSRL